MIRFMIVALLLLPSLAQAAPAVPLRIAVAANFINVMDTVSPTFETTTGLTIQATYGSTGKLYAQIKNGAPYDLFLSADQSRPQLLFEAGICAEPFAYAYGSVVLWSWDTTIEADNWQDLLKSHKGKIAIANPATAPYGTKALQALQKAGLEAPVTSSLVYGQSAGQTFVFVQTKNTHFGFIALSHALSEYGREGQYWPIPEAESVDQWGCVTKKSQNKAAAQQLISFFTTDVAKDTLHNLGYQ